ncbi:hypothetical protein [Bradyrhizobium sp. AUGA SZCCT0160]|uniref:hypothetical protein n=1 Tax=Bradyrhizobium sp. AUGA SZCCT0160 TaxID=2807662 RepID=UPI001BA50B9B|nr:hypothetical protein [Bradyrhizobium sp. AUGA SZCCT0160]MBR1187281.1 hypothetical protein [Bradyrhizobium sp. AUGA SZCCT0160]
MQRRRIQEDRLDQLISEQAERLRDEAREAPPATEREKLSRKARHAETGAHLQNWLKSPGLQQPK